MRYVEDEIRFGHDGKRLRKEARRLLESADCLGIVPTPVEPLLAVSGLQERPLEALDASYVAKLQGSESEALKKALSKVIGAYGSFDRGIYLGEIKYDKRKHFVRLHEVAHGWIVWQRDAYALVEDCERTIAPEIADRFDAEANIFASDILFQLDQFTEQVRSEKFGIKAPLKIGRKFGASAYASIRRFVSMHDCSCAVIVFDVAQNDLAAVYPVFRRVVASRAFIEKFGDIQIPPVLDPQHPLARVAPLPGLKMSRRNQHWLTDINGHRQLCFTEAFNSSKNVFILLWQEGLHEGH